jgi:hypothetical protein
MAIALVAVVAEPAVTVAASPAPVVGERTDVVGAPEFGGLLAPAPVVAWLVSPTMTKTDLSGR